MCATPVMCITRFRIIFSKRRAKNAGLLLSYEKTGHNKTGLGRMGDLLDHWSVRRLKEASADGIKILLYYTPFDPKETNDRKHAWSGAGLAIPHVNLWRVTGPAVVSCLT